MPVHTSVLVFISTRKDFIPVHTKINLTCFVTLKDTSKNPADNFSSTGRNLFFAQKDM